MLNITAINDVRRRVGFGDGGLKELPCGRNYLSDFARFGTCNKYTNPHGSGSRIIPQPSSSYFLFLLSRSRGSYYLFGVPIKYTSGSPRCFSFPPIRLGQTRSKFITRQTFFFASFGSETNRQSPLYIADTGNCGNEMQVCAQQRSECFNADGRKALIIAYLRKVNGLFLEDHCRLFQRL